MTIDWLALYDRALFALIMAAPIVFILVVVWRGSAPKRKRRRLVQPLPGFRVFERLRHAQRRLGA